MRGRSRVLATSGAAGLQFAGTEAEHAADRSAFMELALMLFHQGRADVPIEVMRHPHVELVSSNDHEMRALRTTAAQLKQFGCVPFSYKEIEGAGGGSRGAVLGV